MLSGVNCKHLVQAIPVAVTVLTKDSLSWSHDQNISLATQHGVYIFELNITTEELSPFLMYSRYMHSMKYKSNPYFDTDIDIVGIIDHVDHIEAHKYMLNASLSAPKRAINESDIKNRNAIIAMPGGEPNFAGYMKCVWSPRIFNSVNGCVLGMLTYDHNISFLVQKCNSWIETCNLSEQWLQWLKDNNWLSNNNAENQKYIESISVHKQMKKEKAEILFHIHKERAEHLCISDILWTSAYTYKEAKFTLLIFHTLAGDVVLWDVRWDANNVQTKLISTQSTKCYDVSSMVWYDLDQTEGKYKGILYLGCNSGNILLYYICYEPDKGVTFQPLGSIDGLDDRIAVAKIKLIQFKNSPNTFTMLSAKQNYLFSVIFQIDYDKMSIQTVNTTAIPVGGLAIKELHYDNAVAYLTLSDARLISVNVKCDEEKMDVTLEAADVLFESKCISYNAMVTSPNRAFWAVLETVSIAYDHLVIREPTQISVYMVFGIEEIANYLTNIIPEPLYLYADILEALRLSLHKGDENIIALPDMECILFLPIALRKIYLWILKILDNFHKYYENDANRNSNQLKDALEHSIVEGTARETVQILSTKSLDKTDQISFDMIYKWLTTHGNEEDKKDLVKCSSLYRHYKENCIVCGDSVPLLSLTNGTCNKGHSLARCGRSLRLAMPIFQCKYCLVFLHPEVIAKGLDQCVYCEGPILSRHTRR